MKLKLTTAILPLFISFYSIGQDYSLLSGARSEGLAHASVSVLDAFSTFHNPSLLSWNDENWIGMSGRNNFSISTMNSAFGSIAFRAGNTGNAGFNFQYNGNSGFYDVRAGGYFAKGFGEVFAASISLNLYQHQIKGYDASFAFTSDLGLTAKLEKLVLGLYWGNLNNGEYNGTYNEEIANYLRFGGSYYFVENFFVTLEGVQDLGAEFGMRGGLEYVIEKAIAVRGGYSSLPKSTSIGVSIFIKEFSIDMSGSWHPQLGFSPHVGGTFQW
jgi:hypothetical protein